uniref:Si:dkey-30e9.7 n=1 Tax=Salarias fasciatus TaxID=181472 RepID=A0A672FVR7_SALFA
MEIHSFLLLPWFISCAPGGHTVLQNPYRSTTFSSSWLQQSALQDFICDHSLAAGWYQFQIFDKPAAMPTQCVEVNHCGTQAPVWLSLGDGESLPGPLEVRQLMACATWQLFQSSSKDCCMFRLPVSVRNCGDFYVYLLQPTQGCMAYCAQGENLLLRLSPRVRSNTRTVSPCGQECASKSPPPAPSVPVIGSEVTGSSVHLRCSFVSGSNGSLGFVVAWSRLLSGGRREELKQETTIQTSALIELDGFNLRLGDRIFCSSSSFFLDSPDVRSAAVESQEFFAGIRLIPESSRVSEDGRLYELVVESTVPLPCPERSSSPSSSSSSSTEPCTLSMHLSTSNAGLLGADVSLSSCAVDLPQGPCRDGLCSRALLRFSPVTDFVKDGERTTQISVKPVVTRNFLWNGYSPEPVEITVEDVPSAYCYSFTDPHVITFDGRYYENYQIGTFVLYKSRFSPLEVHVRQWECGSVLHAASCVCGFAARHGGHVLTFDMCDGEMGETEPRLSVKSKDLNGTNVRITKSYQGRKVTMTFSSGAFVRADVSDWGMSLTVRAPGSDRGHTQGLCGTYDGQADNDFQTAGGARLEEAQAFISAWRLPPGNSLFDSVPSDLSPPSPRKYCTCQAEPHTSSSSSSSSSRARSPPAASPDSTCSADGNVRFSTAIPAVDVTALHFGSAKPLEESSRRNRPRQGAHGRRQAVTTTRRQQRRGRRQTHARRNSRLEGFSYFFPEDHEPAVQPDSSPAWPTPSGLTERQARAQCRHTVANSSIAAGCGRLLGAPLVGRAVAMCVADLQLKDEQSWLNATLPLLENECERRQVEESGRSEELRDVLAALRCPGLCSGNGQCSEWGCVCFPGFGSYDCSALSDQIPEITRLEEEGLCDVRRGGCSAVQVHGQSFKDSYELKCEFVKEKFVDGEWILDEPRFVPAAFLDASTLECRLPLEDGAAPAGVDLEDVSNRPLARWQIKVSNDGYSYSNAKILTMYDGACQICSLDTEVLCTLKEKTCNIDGLCYSEGESHPTSPCLTCRPDMSKHTWSTAEKNEPPSLQPPPFPLRSFEGENFIYQLEARDPEGSSVLFTLLSGPESASLSPAGLLMWKARSEPTDTQTFHFTVSDDCQAEKSASVEVSVRPCDCLNGASCAANVHLPAGSGEYVCVCPDGFRGERCEVDVDDCKPNPCRLGRCIDLPNSFSCVCPLGMTGKGRTCREDINECVSQPCFPGVECSNTPGSFTCGPCPQGHRGDGKTCLRKTCWLPLWWN